ncbi:MAG: hypothetical protein KJ720_06395 [Proteobacteria bacterium]|nr:hypothetical protein [Pseudomonadota bacterium]MBU1451158.1 hypothetical protein [Pseudomonadota bacterium]MBU2467369.1 hypothetical protein [Pseudomonadota bacterium]MBU2517049.1 hypothetical protein [Pseudomonadota bacterium]
MNDDVAKRLDKMKAEAIAMAEMLAALKSGLVNKGFSTEEALAVVKAAAAAHCSSNGNCSS